MIRLEPGLVRGSLQAPPSKSLMQRAVAAALLVPGTSRLRNPATCDDAQAALRVAEALGAELWWEGGEVLITGGRLAPRGPLDCGESGLCMRMFAPIAALQGEPSTLVASGSLAARPVDMIEAPLRRLGARVTTRDGHPPIEVRGPLQGGEVEVDGSVSSQFLTGLLMALPCCPQHSTVQARSLRSRPYVQLTLELLRGFGIEIAVEGELETFRIPGGQRYRPTDYTVEGDWSGAASLLVAGALGGSLTVRGLRADSLQADRAILAALEACGASVEVEPGAVRVARGGLRAFSFDASECPDLFPPLVALACHCEGVTTLRGANRLTHKESDRAAVLCREFGRLGGVLEVEGDLLHIRGGGLRGGEAETHGDHRIAMAVAATSVVSLEGISLHGETCVAKSFPEFFARFGEIRP